MAVSQHMSIGRSGSDLDHLIIATNPGSGDSGIGQFGDSSTMSAMKASGQFHGDRGMPYRPVVLQPEHVNEIQRSAKVICESQNYRNYEPEPYSKKLGSEMAYQEMISLLDTNYKEEEDEDPEERMELMRKHSMVFRPSGPNSRALTLYEQAVNEAATQICRHFPGLVFHKRDLAILAKQAVKLTGIEFPNSRSTYLAPTPTLSSMAAASKTSGQLQMQQQQQPRPTPASQAPASMLLQKSGVLAGRRDYGKSMLSANEGSILARAAMELAGEIPRRYMKSREECNLIENFVYRDAETITNLPQDRLDEKMDYIREVSLIFGRFPSGPRDPNVRLTPYQQGINEAAAWLVRLRPDLLTHREELTQWAQKVVKLSGLALKNVLPLSATGSSQQTGSSHQLHSGSAPDKTGLGLPNRAGAGNDGSEMIHIRLQGNDLYAAMSGGGTVGGGSSVGGLGVGLGGGTSTTILGDAMFDSLEEGFEMGGGGAGDLIAMLGGPAGVAHLTDDQLQELARSQIAIVDQATAAEIAHIEANSALQLSAEEDDSQLNEAEILRLTGAKDLSRVRSLRVACSGYTSISSTDLARCVMLTELDLSENLLRLFPRRLHLPRLRRVGLSGNRFINLPMVEQFPQLTRLTIDDKYKQLLNPQMLAYFCPRLKLINGQYFEEVLSEFTVRIIQEAKATVEPHIRSKWESEFADRYHSVRNREERLALIEGLVQQLREKNLFLDETIGKYKDLLLFRFAEDYLKSKLFDPEDELLAGSRSVGREGEPGSGAGSGSISVSGGGLLDEAEEEDDEEDEEAEAEARAAGERALFSAAEELMGLNLTDLVSTQQQQQQQQSTTTTLLMDHLGRIIPASQQQLQALGAVAGGQQQFHLGRSLRQGKSVVMTLVRPRGISGRPVAEFLPGELRNKDYVKGYMASEIYKKTVKDTLGQKGTPKKRPGTGRPRRPDQQHQGGESGGRQWPPGTSPLNEMNNQSGDMDGGEQGVGSVSMTAAPTVGLGSGPGVGGVKRRGRPREGAGSGLVGAPDQGGGEGVVGGLPPRPKKRRPMGMHKSLRDLCTDLGSESAAGGTSMLTPVAPAAGGSGYTVSNITGTSGAANLAGTSGITPPAVASTASGVPLIDYDPLHFIRCHAKDNDAADNETKVWRCLFEPNPVRPEETTHVVATCGGECVCLINCETGKVMKRFKHMEEEFLTIAWTTVEVEGGKRTNLLAAAGRMREIRLLHPEQLVCYAEMKGHMEVITAMIFHPTQPTILFSGDSKASVVVWDIGVPSVPDYKTRTQLLMRLRCPRLDVNAVLNLVFLPHYAYLLAGCEDGIFAWKITDFRVEKREREPDMELKLPTDKEVCLDGLSQLSDNALVVKVVDAGAIYVFDFASVLEKRKGLQRTVPVEIRGVLSWQKTEEIYINVSVRQNLGAVLCGDSVGSIWIYDLDPYLDDLHASSRKKFHVQPIKVLDWPECSVQGNRDEDQQLKDSIIASGFRQPVVNTVEMSSDGHYLVAVTDNNLVCIWRYAPPQAAVPVYSLQPGAAGGTGAGVGQAQSGGQAQQTIILRTAPSGPASSAIQQQQQHQRQQYVIVAGSGGGVGSTGTSTGAPTGTILVDEHGVIVGTADDSQLLDQQHYYLQ